MPTAQKSSPVVSLSNSSRYHIPIHSAPSHAETPLRLLLTRNEDCINCGICIESCIYGVHHRRDDMRMPLGAVDQTEHLCRYCLRCVRDCPKEALSVPVNPEFVSRSYGHWTAAGITALLRQAETGKVPVSGAGYNGKFAGTGFDAIWTDMSEIVRPTRDGIHGREYISTSIVVGSRPAFVNPFSNTADGLRLVEIPIPLLFDVCCYRDVHSSVTKTIIETAEALKTVVFVPAEEVGNTTTGCVVPVFRPSEIDSSISTRFFQEPLIVELEYGANLAVALGHIRRELKRSLVSVRLPFDANIAEALLTEGVNVLHFMAGPDGATDMGHMSKALRAIHARLVDKGVRESVTILAGGCVAAAEHVAKSILCGADGVSVDLSLLTALQVWQGGDPEETMNRFTTVDPEWGRKRIENLMAAWRDQLLELLGAMGMREVRRLRGEIGRGLFYEDLLREFKATFASPLEVRADIDIPDETIPAITAPISPVKRNFHNELSKFRVVVNDACIHCGICVDTCPYGVFQMPNAFNRLLTTSSQCIGSACESEQYYCVPKCPTDAISIGKDETFNAMGDARWTADLLVSTYKQAETGARPPVSFESETGLSDGGFDRIRVKHSEVPHSPVNVDDRFRTAIPLNRRKEGADIWIPVPWYGGGMSYGSISLEVMQARAKAAKAFGTFISTGEGGYPDALTPYADHVITQLATGLFGVREDTIRRARIVEFKYAQGAKPGLGGHLLADKVTADVARMRGSMQWSSLFSPFPFHSVYSVEDHKKHLDWIRATNPGALISVKVSTPSDVDMVAVGSYYAGANILQLDGSYGGTGAAPDIAKKNIAMPIEFAIPKVHRFLMDEGIRDEMVILASGGVRTALDIVKAVCLGADGVVIGTAELIAIECDRCTNCERGRGCPFGIATSDPELSQLIDVDWAAQRIINLFHSWRAQLIDYLNQLGVPTILQLRGRTDLLEYVE